MKRLLLLGALIGARNFAARCQTIPVMAEQLAELKLYEQTIATGYQLMTSGVDTIGTINANTYQLHAGYFASLDVIKPSVGDDPVVRALTTLQAILVQQIRARLTYWNNLKNQIE